MMMTIKLSRNKKLLLIGKVKVSLVMINLTVLLGMKFTN